MDSAPFGDTRLGPVRRLTIGREPGLVVEVLDLGAALHGVWVTVGDERRNVVLSLPTAAEYADGRDYTGAVVGRYANRIAGAELDLDGHRYALVANEGRNVLHGGPDGFHRRTWTVAEHEDDHVTLHLTSPDGDQGFPGTLEATVTYAVAGETGDTLRIELTATTDAPTYASLASHGYWNLDGTPTVEDHLLQVRADRYLPVDDELIPTGEQREVHDEFDLREPQRVSGRFLDHNFVLSPGSGQGTGPQLTLEAGALRLHVSTDAPGLQVHTADKHTHAPRGGLALEPQLFPDSPHHPDFPSAVLRPGETFRSVSEWQITAT